jgi:hypothetical protein
MGFKISSLIFVVILNVHICVIAGSRPQVLVMRSQHPVFKKKKFKESAQLAASQEGLSSVSE